jgi:hypothetical protein
MGQAQLRAKISGLTFDKFYSAGDRCRIGAGSPSPNPAPISGFVPQVLGLGPLYFQGLSTVSIHRLI